MAGHGPEDTYTWDPANVSGRYEIPRDRGINMTPGNELTPYAGRPLYWHHTAHAHAWVPSGRGYLHADIIEMLNIYIYIYT